jgi:hypothetical protein
MSNTMIVRGAVITGLVGCALAAGSGAAFATDAATATACTNGATNYPDCTPTVTHVTPGTGAVTVVSGGAGTTATAAPASSLPFTGFETGAAAAIGLAALGAGTIFIVGSRRRRGGSASA